MYNVGTQEVSTQEGYDRNDLKDDRLHIKSGQGATIKILKYSMQDIRMKKRQYSNKFVWSCSEDRRLNEKRRTKMKKI